MYAVGSPHESRPTPPKIPTFPTKNTSSTWDVSPRCYFSYHSNLYYLPYCRVTYRFGDDADEPRRIRESNYSNPDLSDTDSQ